MGVSTGIVPVISPNSFARIEDGRWMYAMDEILLVNGSLHSFGSDSALSSRQTTGLHG
ncbi:MAG TPA: hypothetical protein VHO70_17505 [Chitinispirillaceae bacterium]|nr:hypothetical protein [Chitinispirillaceae bacterium]